jgi:hypothetical protein
VPGVPGRRAAGGAEPHVWLRPSGVELHPGGEARAVRRRRQGHRLRRDRPGADRDEEGPGVGVLERGVQRPAPADFAPPARCVPSVLCQGARYPRFKSYRGRQSATYTRSAFSMRAGVLRLAKMGGRIQFVWTWPRVDVTALDPRSVTVTREPCGRWFVTLHVDVPDLVPLPPTGESIGVDLGLADLAILSLVPLVQDLLGVRALARRT